jgi:TonB family protein
MKLRLILPALFLTGVASAQERPAPPAHVMPPPRPISVPPAPSPGPMLVELTPGEARCEDGVARLVRVERPLPVSGFGNRGTLAAPVTLRFRIDAQGRPLSIVQEPTDEFRPGRLYYTATDVIPAFAVSRFAAASERKNCSIRFEPHVFAVGDAPLPLVRRYFVTPHQRQSNERELFRRLHPADTDCVGGRAPKLRLRAFPAFEEIPIEPGGWAYAMTSFDIDAKGRPINVKIVGSDGNAALDRASIDAVKGSRYAPDARRGCTYPYYRRSETTVEAPPSPQQASFRPAEARCPDGDTAWTTMPKLQFPSGFTQRRIEGWAIIGYDVAPWGSTGNVRVLAAEPAAVFGEQARGIVTNARQSPSKTGRVGCVDIVRFVMPKKGQEAGEGEEE